MAESLRRIREASTASPDDGSGTVQLVRAETRDGKDTTVFYVAWDRGGDSPVLVSEANPLPVSGPLTDTQLRAASVDVLESKGTFGYEAATLTSGSLAITGRVVNFRVFAHGVEGSFKIGASGDTITVRADTGFDYSPRTALISPEFFWLAGELDLFVEVVT